MLGAQLNEIEVAGEGPIESFLASVILSKYAYTFGRNGSLNESKFS